MAKKTKAYFLLFLLLIAISLFVYKQKDTTLAISAPADQQTILVKYQDSNEIVTIKLQPGQSIEQAIKDYEKDPIVEYAEPNYTYQAAATPNDIKYNNQWYLKRIDANKAWGINHDSKDIIIAVLDSGVQIAHPDLKNNIWINTKEIPNNNIDDDNNGYIDDYNGYDFVNRVADPNPKFKLGFTEDGVTHGTIIAGILAAESNNEMGIAGITWNAKIMPLKTLDDRGQTDSSKVIESINYAVAQKANIINMSFVGYGYSKGVQQAIRRAYDAGVIIVAAGGNDQGDGYGHLLDDNPMYPACHDDPNGDNLVIGVAATGPIDQKSYFSSYGKCIDITAPGVSFYSTVPVDERYIINNQVFNKYYDGYWSGTSFSVPIISGTLALMQQMNPGLDPQATVDILLKTADNIEKLNANYQGQLGSGRINMAKALQEAVRIKSNITKGLVIAQKNTIQIINFNQELVSEFTVKDFSNINVSSADLDNDGQAEIIVTSAGRGQPLVKVFDLLGNLKFEFMAYPEYFRGGVQTTIADLNNDKEMEIITGPGTGWKPEIKVFDMNGNFQYSFLAYASTFGGGVNLTTGDLDNNGRPEIITAPHSQGGPHIRRFDPDGRLLSQFFALRENHRNSYQVTTTSTFNLLGQNDAKILVSAGQGLNPDIRIFDEIGTLTWKIGVYNNQYGWGVNMTTSDLDRDGQAEIITAPNNGLPIINIYSHRGLLLDSFTLESGDEISNIHISTINL